MTQGDTLDGTVGGLGGTVGGPVGTGVSNLGTGTGNLVSETTGGLGDGVQKLTKGDVVGGLGSVGGAVPKGLYGLGTGLLGIGKEKEEEDTGFLGMGFGGKKKTSVEEKEMGKKEK